MSLENTPLYNSQFSEPVPDIAGRDIDARFLARHIMQQVIGETRYKSDTEWGVWHRAHEMEETNGLPNGVTAVEVHQEYLRMFEGE